ncbi:oligosaccharide flippase family protein [Lysinibacillus sp. NPDC098008]|uniref:oligosaccharide flippase family protein n=1 Tax=Lysinibacillus sp. NPDC098008 TaxID=3364146 RepID=UPI00381B4D6B
MKKNLLYVTFVNLVNGFAGIAFIPLALKSLGTEGYGLYSIFVILVSYIYFVEMGVAKYFTRTIAQASNVSEEQKIMRSATGMYIRITLLLFIITPILFFIIPKWVFPTNNHGLVSIIVIFASLDYLLSIPPTIKLTYNLGKEEFEHISKFNLISGLSKHLFLIGSVLIFKSVILLIITVLLRRVFDILYAKKFLKSMPKGSWQPQYAKGEFKKIFSQSIVLSMAQLTQITILSIGTFLINRNFTMKEVGIYKATFDLASKVSFFSNSLGMVVFPRFSSVLKRTEEKISLLNKMPLYYKISWLVYSILFLISLVIIPIIPNILNIQDMELFYLLLYGACLNAHANLSYEFLQADARLKEVIIPSIITLLMMSVIFYLTLDYYSFYAIGISWVLSQVFNSMCMDTMVLRKIRKSSSITTICFNLIISIGVIILYLSLGVY